MAKAHRSPQDGHTGKVHLPCFQHDGPHLLKSDGETAVRCRDFLQGRCVGQRQPALNRKAHRAGRPFTAESRSLRQNRYE